MIRSMFVTTNRNCRERAIGQGTRPTRNRRSQGACAHEECVISQLGQNVPGGDTREPAGQTRCLDPKFSPLHQTGASSSQAAGAIERRLLFDLRNRVEISDPALCRAKPKLLFGTSSS